MADRVRVGSDSAGGEAVPPGLVSFSTSDTAPQTLGLPGDALGTGPHQVIIDSHLGRLKRMRSGVLTAANLIQERLAASGRRWKAAMLHLTYRDEDEFSPDQMSALMKHIREWTRRRGLPALPYVWVLERGEKRGRLHYHILIWLPLGVTLPKPDKQGWWPWGHTKWEWARQPVGYLAKYASKGWTKDGKVQPSFPKGSRIHGKGGLTAVERSKCAWWRAPKWVKDAWPDWQDEPRPAPGGGWVSRVLGDWLPSPWRLVGFDLGRPVVRWVADSPCPYALELPA
ncbi:rolling circle replication-associated protein [Allochromatium palmeri]|uniref:Replication-associated protein ORF2/G2P domain-containing protein n=1 Tax=Allochromatium palmeri TaxID=231048 RepID=A0A6N8EA74_9GAMM|nr:hypothetical protein [Allochromatium palmeri]MTW21172.1 hypothetical protein [Allochromatium palmeri]